MASITSANAVLLLGVNNVFPVPQQLQQFAADDIFDIETLQSAEVLMGVDGWQSGGFVFVPIKQTIALQADSVSNAVFDAWWNAQQQTKDIYYAFGSITLNSLGKKYNLTRGVLVTYPPVASGRRVLQPRCYTISWQNIVPAPSNAVPNN